LKPLKIPIKGVIVSNDDKWIYEWFGFEATSPNDVTELIKTAGKEDLEVEINSGGGDVYAGSEIYTALMSYKGKVIIDIVGVAASAAGVIAMAGRPTRISPTAQLMLHNVMAGDYGDYRVLQHGAEIIKNYNISIANAYRLKSGMEENKLLELMDAGGSINYGTWLNAQQALENKFVDEIMFDTGKKLAASTSFSGSIPPGVINKLKSHFKQIKSLEEEEGTSESKLKDFATKDDLLAMTQMLIDELKPKAIESKEPEELKPEPPKELNPPNNERVLNLQETFATINQLNERSNKRK
jgi:ATP-dependent Clp protease protease subunit